jgi:hypothetical protein
MTRRIIQLELVARHRAQFAREAGRLNYGAVGTARAQHERHLSSLAAAYRIGRLGQQGTAWRADTQTSRTAGGHSPRAVSGSLPEFVPAHGRPAGRCAVTGSSALG